MSIVVWLLSIPIELLASFQLSSFFRVSVYEEACYLFLPSNFFFWLETSLNHKIYLTCLLNQLANHQTPLRMPVLCLGFIFFLLSIKNSTHLRIISI